MTLIEVLRLATGYLQDHRSSSPRLDAEVLLAHSLGLRRLDLYLQFERPMVEAELVPYRTLLTRRGRGEPVAYLVGRREFMKLDFAVTPDVLIPQPDTETLVVRAIELLRGLGRPARAADVGTGSGAIAVALAHYVPDLTVDACDVSASALAVAANNAERLGVAERVRFCAGELLAPLAGPYDLVCANLPYVAEGTQLPAEVAAQPALALFAGDGGAALVRRLLVEAPARLGAGGTVLAEADGPVLERVAGDLGAYRATRVHRDLGGRERVLEATL